MPESECATDGETPTSALPKYRIGTVVQLTGLSADTIRAWERRYETIAPARSAGGTRLYSDDEVTRLQLLRALTESGQPIGSIAGLDTEALRGRLAAIARAAEQAQAGAPARQTAPLRIAVLDPSLRRQLELGAADAADLEWVAAGVGRAPSPGDAGGRADVVVAHLSLLGPSPAPTLAACREAWQAGMSVVLYEFASRKVLARLAAQGARLIRGPVSVAQLRRAMLDLFVIQEARRGRGDAIDAAADPAPRAPIEPPARRLRDEELARLLEARSSVECECPNHLAQIVSSLLAFEAYAASCESDQPDDASVHAALRRGTGRARALMEQLLLRLCEHDGIRLGDPGLRAR